jgi:GNAT superfamily N-acetyltransferase
MIVRVAERDDIPQLLQLYRHLTSDEAATVDDAQASRELLKRYPGSDIFVGCLANDIVSTCTLVVVPNLTRGGRPYALIENVVTNSAHRQQGYGKAVLREAIAAAWHAGCYKVMLLTGSDSPAVHKFYLDVGFEQSKTGYQIRRLLGANQHEDIAVGNFHHRDIARFGGKGFADPADR